MQECLAHDQIVEKFLFIRFPLNSSLVFIEVLEEKGAQLPGQLICPLNKGRLFPAQCFLGICGQCVITPDSFHPFP